MPGICENGLGLVNNCVYYACQTHEVYQLLPYSVDFKDPVAFLTKEVNPRLAKRPSETNGRLANRRLTSLVKEATGE